MNEGYWGLRQMIWQNQRHALYLQLLYIVACIRYAVVTQKRQVTTLIVSIFIAITKCIRLIQYSNER